MKSFKPLSNPTLVPCILGSSWCMTMPSLTLIQENAYGTLCLSPSNTTSLHLSLFRSSMMPWSRSGRKYPRAPSVVLLGACPNIFRHTYKNMGPYKLLSNILSCCKKNSPKLTSLLHHFFTLIFGVFEFSPLKVENVHFHQTMWCGFPQ